MKKERLLFRAYDKKNKCWIYSNHNSESSDISWFWKMINDCSDCDVMFFLGEKDKKGQAIWEGDIILAKRKGCTEEANEDYFNEFFIDVVTMEDFRYWLKGEKTDETHRIDPKECDVIGNIYDNNFLLKIYEDIASMRQELIEKIEGKKEKPGSVSPYDLVGVHRMMKNRRGRERRCKNED